MNRKGFSLIEISFSLGILIIAGAVAYYFLYLLPQQNSSGSVDIKVTPPSQAQPLPPTPPPAAPAQIPLSPETLGKSFVIDNVQYTVQSAKNLGNQLSTFTKPSTGTYIQIKFLAENVGTQSVPVKPIFYLLDSGNRQFKTALAMFYQPPNGYTEYDSSYGDSPYGMMMSPITLQPGFSQKLFAIFEVPLASSGFKLVMANGTSQNFYVSLGL